MVSAGQSAQFEERAIRVPKAEDLALLMLVAEDEAAVQRLTMLPGFDRQAFNDRLTSIGLGAVAE
jgi:hypothetical protein